MSMPAPTRTGPNFSRQGAIILSVFALIWALAGASGIGGGAVYWGIGAVALVISLGAIAFAVRSEPDRGASRRVAPDWQRRYNLVGIAEGVAILVAIVALIWIDVPGLIPPVVCLIVGIHFLPLESIFGQREYRWTALALCAVAVVGAAMLSFASEEAVRAIVGFGAAIVLWSTAIVVARIG